MSITTEKIKDTFFEYDSIAKAYRTKFTSGYSPFFLIQYGFDNILDEVLLNLVGDEIENFKVMSLRAYKDYKAKLSEIKRGVNEN